MNELITSIIQADLAWENKKTNLRHFDHLIASISNTTNLIILPEMFTTGFSMNVSTLAEGMDGTTMQWLAEKADASNAVICGSFIAKEHGKFYNRFVWMQPGGSYESYDKRHLFTLAGEQHHFSFGKKKVTVTINGWKVLPLICYDLRFPVWSRNDMAYDLLIYVANFPEKRSTAWKSLLQARAIENQAYTIGVNRVGIDGNDISYSGDSSVFDYEGKLLQQLSYKEGAFTTILKLEQQQQFRKKFAFLDDQDKFEIEL